MPTYRVTDPTTGRTVKLTGDSPPTEQELEGIFAQIAAPATPKVEVPEQQPTIADDPMAAMTNAVNTPIDFSGIKQAAGQTMDYITQPIPVPESTGQFMTENLPRSVARFPAAMAIGTGGMMYNAAKKFTDPVVNAWSGRQDLGSAAKDLFYAPRDAGNEIFNALAHGTGAPLGVYGKEEAKKAWSDPAAAGAAVAPLAVGGAKGLKAYGDYITPAPTIEGLQNELGQIVGRGFDKGIKPKGTPKTRNMLLEEQRLQQEAVQSIINGKEYLKFRDKHGEISEGHIPQNLDEFSQAIEQRKLATITKANEMNTAAGEAGVTVPLNNIITELQKVVDDKVYNLESRSMVNYARQKIKAYQESGPYTPEEAQKAMAIANQSKAIADATMTPYNVSKAKVDALIANNLRKNLNEAVESASGPGYSALRKEYGALKSIEEPVNRRLKQFSQQNEKSALNLYDVFSYSDLFSGTGQVVAGNTVSGLGAILKGIGLKGVAEQIKIGKDPNRAVNKMFQKADPVVGKLQGLISERDAASIVAEVEAKAPGILALPPPERGFSMRNPEDVYSPWAAQSPYSPELAAKVNQLGLPYQERLGLPMPERGFSMQDPAQVYSPYSPELAGQTRRALPPPERGFSMRNPEEVYSPYSPEFAGQVPNQLALPPGTPQETFRPPSAFDRLVQIAQSPAGRELLLERLGREEKNSKLLQALMNVPEPPPVNYPLVPVPGVKVHYINQKPNPLGE